MLFADILAIFDPVSWFVIHWGVSKAIAVAIVAGAVVIALLTFAMILSWINKIKLEYRQTKYTKILKDHSKEEYTVTVISMDATGKVVDGKEFKAKDLDDELKKLPDMITL